jgi:hypothetical protein
MPNNHKIHIPNGRKILQIIIKYAKNFDSKPLQNFYPNWDFGFENMPSGSPGLTQLCGSKDWVPSQYIQNKHYSYVCMYVCMYVRKKPRSRHGAWVCLSSLAGVLFSSNLFVNTVFFPLNKLSLLYIGRVDTASRVT